jgi:hypothetical protein
MTPKPHAAVRYYSHQNDTRLAVWKLGATILDLRGSIAIPLKLPRLLQSTVDKHQVCNGMKAGTTSDYRVADVLLICYPRFSVILLSTKMHWVHISIFY